MTDDLYWFGVTAVFRCQTCTRENIERMVVGHLRSDLSEIKQKVHSRVRACQICSTPIIDEKDIALYVLPGTPEYLRNKGFPVPLSVLIANAS
jgi:hypothetical protein